ncbi:MAG: DUF1287 domain-containing protein [Pseudomonadota bacterium]
MLQIRGRIIAWVLSCLTVAAAHAETWALQLTDAALERTRETVVYDGRYSRLEYPGGDVPAHIGVCTDLVIRAYRALGVDLQQLVHEDMRADFDRYPSQRIWGLQSPDANIDHRRVPNLETFFEAHAEVLATTGADSFEPGDLVTWRLPGGAPHIGIVLHERSADGQRPLIAHNIGRGPEVEDMLFDFPIVGHYRYVPEIAEGGQ